MSTKACEWITASDLVAYAGVAICPCAVGRPTASPTPTPEPPSGCVPLSGLRSGRVALGCHHALTGRHRGAQQCARGSLGMEAGNACPQAHSQRASACAWARLRAHACLRLRVAQVSARPRGRTPTCAHAHIGTCMRARSACMSVCRGTQVPACTRLRACVCTRKGARSARIACVRVCTRTRMRLLLLGVCGCEAAHL